MRHFKTKAFILKRNPVNENHLFLTVFTKQKGKIQVFAKHSTNIKSKFLGKIEPLTLTNIEVYESPRNYYLQSSKLISKYNIEDPTNFYILSIISEILNKLLPENEKNLSIFQILENTIQNNNLTNQKNLLSAIIKILKNLGYLHISTQCQECGTPFTENSSIYLEELHHLNCNKCAKNKREISKRTFKTLLYMYKEESHTINKIQIPQQNILEAYQIITEIIQAQIQTEIKSKNFISLIPHS